MFTSIPSGKLRITAFTAAIVVMLALAPPRHSQHHQYHKPAQHAHPHRHPPRWKPCKRRSMACKRK